MYVKVHEIFATNLLIDVILLLAGIEICSFAFGVVVAESDGVGDLLLHKDVHELVDGLLELAMPVVAGGVVAGQDDERRAVFADALPDQLFDRLFQWIGTLRVGDLHHAEVAARIESKLLDKVGRDGG